MCITGLNGYNNKLNCIESLPLDDWLRDTGRMGYILDILNTSNTAGNPLRVSSFTEDCIVQKWFTT